MVFALLISSDTSHYENVPFDIPEGWCWCKLDDLAFYKKGPFGSSLTKSMFVPDAVDVFKVYEQKNAIQKDDALGTYFIDSDKFQELKGFEVYPRDIIVSCAGTIGETYVMPNNIRRGIINQALMLIRLYLSDIQDFYLLYFDFILKEEAAKESKGTAIKNIPPFDVLKNFYIPIPPIAEQKRIISEVEKWSSLVEVIESGENEIHNCISSAKAQILDLAIRGKLVPQDANDESASALLKRLGISSDNRPYEKKGQELPPNWSWCKLDSICSFLSRGKSPKYSETDRTYPVFAQKCNLKDGGISLEQARFLEPTTVCKWADVYKLRTGDVLVNSTGTGTVGRTRLFNESCLGDYPFVVPDSHVTVIRTIEEICSEYIYILLSSNEVQQYMEDNLAGSTNQKELYIGIIGNIDVPLPPFEEQVRIAKKVDTLYTQLEDIGAMLA